MRASQAEYDLERFASEDEQRASANEECRLDLVPEHVALLFDKWRARELRAARRWRECRGVSDEQLKDIYQDTTLTLILRDHHDEQHLRYALREGIRMRALKAHRDEVRHEEILASNVHGLRLAAEAREMRDRPESTLLARQDWLIVCEFMTELNDTEKQTFSLLAEGMSYNRIARLLGIDTNDARRAVQTCERKRERFQLFYNTGRLCGYREATILALQEGRSISQELADQALAHLEACSKCCAQHRTNASRLRQRFGRQAAALMPLPALAPHVGWLTRTAIHGQVMSHRLIAIRLIPQPGGVRERTVAVLAGSGAASKLATGVATVTVLAGSAIGVTHALAHPHHHATRTRPVQQEMPGPGTASSASRAEGLLEPTIWSLQAPRPKQPSAPGHVVLARTAGDHGTPRAKREPNGLVYLGLPGSTARKAPSQRASQSNGGPFSP